MARRKKLTACQTVIWYIAAVVRWIPILFVLAIMGWTVYAYVFVLCIQVVESHGLRAVYLIGYFILMFLLLWSFLSTVLINPSPVPDAFQLSDEELDQLDRLQNDAVAKNDLLKQIIAQRARNLPIYERWPAPEDWPSGIRFCHKCELIKPDRTHHCSLCGRCIPKFDHHCPWVNNCVCHSNYKFFLLFLGYSLLLCLWGGFTCLPYFIRFWQHDLNYVEGKFHILFMPFVALTFSLSISGLFCFHLWLVSKNRTTIESSRYPAFAFGPDKNGYNMGCATNFRHVFGPRPILWFLPVNTSYGDGFSFPVRRLQQQQQQQQQPSQQYLQPQLPREVSPAYVEDGNMHAADLSDVTLSSRYNNGYSNSDAAPRGKVAAHSTVENERLSKSAADSTRTARKSSSSESRSSRNRSNSNELNGNGAVYSGRHGGNAYVVHDNNSSFSNGARAAVPGEAVRTSHNSTRHTSRHDDVSTTAPLSKSYQQYYRGDDDRQRRYSPV